MIKNLFWLFETFFLGLLSFFVPKNKSLLVFWSSRWKNISWNPMIFYKYLDSLEWLNYDLRYHVHEDNSLLWYNVFGWNKFIIWRNLLRANYIFIDYCGFDVWINWVLRWKFNVIQMRHWEWIKSKGLLSSKYLSNRNSIVLFFEKREYNTYKYILGNPWTKWIKELVFNNKNILEFGVPRNDLLIFNDIRNIVEKKDVKSFINNFSEFDKVILYAPTFKKYNNDPPFSFLELSFIQEMCENMNYIFLFKKHIHDNRDFFNGQPYEYNNIIDVWKLISCDSTDLLPHIDILVTDFSSIYIDFVLSKKPILFYHNKLTEYLENERELLYDVKLIRNKETTAIQFETLIYILSNINWIVITDEYKSERIRLENFFYSDYDRINSVCSKLLHLIN